METKENRIRFYRDLAARFRADLIGSKLYLIPRFSLDAAAARLGVSRYNISHAVNVCLGKNFCRIVNELRIAEAVRLMQALGAGSSESTGSHSRSASLTARPSCASARRSRGCRPRN